MIGGIVTAEDVYGTWSDAPGAFAVVRYMEARQREEALRIGSVVTIEAAPVPDSTAKDPIAVVHVSANRFCVDCPFPGCGSAALASAEDHRFWCWECKSAAVGGAFVDAQWPARLNQVVKVLAERPAQNRHYFPHFGEDLGKLKLENKLYLPKEF